MIQRSWIEKIFGIYPKSPKQIKQESEYENEDNYRIHKIKVLKQAREYKKKNKMIIEFRLKKDIELVTLKDLIHCGFQSDDFTRKHLEEVKK